MIGHITQFVDVVLLEHKKVSQQIKMESDKRMNFPVSTPSWVLCCISFAIMTKTWSVKKEVRFIPTGHTIWTFSTSESFSTRDEQKPNLPSSPTLTLQPPKRKYDDITFRLKQEIIRLITGSRPYVLWPA